MKSRSGVKTTLPVFDPDENINIPLAGPETAPLTVNVPAFIVDWSIGLLKSTMILESTGEPTSLCSGVTDSAEKGIRDFGSTVFGWESLLGFV